MARPKESRRRRPEVCPAGSDGAPEGSSSVAGVVASNGNESRDVMGLLRERLDVPFWEKIPTRTSFGAVKSCKSC